jgi:RNA methyltransferase, TrmH family
MSRPVFDKKTAGRPRGEARSAAPRARAEPRATAQPGTEPRAAGHEARPGPRAGALKARRAPGTKAHQSSGHGPAATTRVVGLAAAHAVLRMRPSDVLQIAHARSARHELKGLLREAARLRIAYREVENAELERIADTVHHEGICLLVKQQPEPRVSELVRALDQPGLLLALDRVENPHNVGALLRSAAYFGVRGLLLVSPRGAALTPATVRVAEGGAEHVPTCLVPSLVEPLDLLRSAGVAIIGADAHRGQPITEFRFPARAVLVLGSERHGLASEVEQRCTDLVHIPGTDAVESLNVSVAAGILLAFAARRGARAS